MKELESWKGWKGWKGTNIEDVLYSELVIS